MAEDATVRPRRRPGRPAGDGAGRDALLDAAKTLFAAHGYDGASVRKIAAEAGVDPGLIRHFFTDKAGLFAATLTDRSRIIERIQQAFTGDRERIGERLVVAYLDMWDDPETGPMLESMVRTALTSERWASLLREILTTRVFTAVSGEPEAEPDLPTRIMLCGTQLLGIAIARNVVDLEPLAGARTEALAAVFAPTIQRYLTGPLPELV